MKQSDVKMGMVVWYAKTLIIAITDPLKIYYIISFLKDFDIYTEEFLE